MRKRSAILTINANDLMMRVLLVILAAAIGFGVPASSSAQTLRGESFVTESGDHSVEWNANWDASLMGEDDFSTMVMLENQIMIYAVMFIHDEDLGLSERAVYHSLSGVLVNSFNSPPTYSIEWEGDDGSYRGAHLVELAGIDFVLFFRIDPPTPGSGPTMQFAAAPVRAFPTSLAAMQTELTVDGIPVFDGENGEDVLAQIEVESDTATESETAADEAPAPSSATESSGPSNPLEERTRGQRDPGAARGQTNGNTYTSATHGFTVSYPDSWLDMAGVNSTIGEFSLESDSGRSVVSFSGRSTTETNRQAFFEDIVVRESRYPGYVGSVITDDRLIIATWTNDNELAILEYVFVDDSTVVTIMVTITSGNPDRYVADAEEITLNGDPILRDWEDLWGGE